MRYTLSFAVGRVELCNFVTDLNRYQTKTSHFQTFKPDQKKEDWICMFFPALLLVRNCDGIRKKVIKTIFTKSIKSKNIKNVMLIDI